MPVKLNLGQQMIYTVLGVKQVDQKYRCNPAPDYLLMEGERLMVMGSARQLEVARQILKWVCFAADDCFTCAPA